MPIIEIIIGFILFEFVAAFFSLASNKYDDDYLDHTNLLDGIKYIIDKNATYFSDARSNFRMWLFIIVIIFWAIHVISCIIMYIMCRFLMGIFRILEKIARFIACKHPK